MSRRRRWPDWSTRTSCRCTTSGVSRVGHTSFSAWSVVALPRSGWRPEAGSRWNRPLARSPRSVARCAAAHVAGVVHGDVKPANILFDDDGRAYLTDFGIATLVNKVGCSADDASWSSGSPLYSSPEQSRHATIDVRADQYSLALTMWELLAGTPPFAGTQASEVLADKWQAPLPPISLAVPEVPGGPRRHPRPRRRGAPRGALRVGDSVRRRRGRGRGRYDHRATPTAPKPQPTVPLGVVASQRGRRRGPRCRPIRSRACGPSPRPTPTTSSGAPAPSAP